MLLVLACLGAPRPARAQTCFNCGTDTSPPVIVITPGTQTYTASSAPVLAVTIDICDASALNSSTLAVTFRGASVASSVTWTSPTKAGCTTHRVGQVSLTLAQGSNVLAVSEDDFFENSGSAQATYTWNLVTDAAPPTIDALPPTKTVASPTFSVTFNWADDHALDWSTRKVRFNGADVTAQFPLSSQTTTQGASTGTVTLVPGTNTFLDSIADQAGKRTARTFSYTYDVTGPTVAITSPLAASAPDAQRTVNVAWKDVGGVLNGRLKVALNGALVTGSFSSTFNAPGDSALSVATLPMALGENVVDVEACDAFGHCSTQSATFVRYAGAKQAPVLSLDGYSGDVRNVALFGGNVSYTTAPYVSMDAPHSVTLFYSTGQAKPTGFVQVDAADYSSTPPEKMSLALLNSSGAAVAFTGGQTELFFAGGNGTSRLSAQFDASSLATGAYAYTAVVKSWFAGDPTPTQASIPVRVLVVNEMSSPFGIGWSVSGLARLYSVSGGVMVTGGDGTAEFFATGTCSLVGGTYTCSYTPPTGEYATLSYVGSQSPPYTLTFPNGSKAYFSSGGQLTGTADLFGNAASFAYDGSSRLTTITDPAGKQISLAYGTSGKLTSITDQPTATPRRTSRFTVSAAGELSAAYDADGVRADTLVYDALHRISAWTDRAGGTYAVSYDAFGQLASMSTPPMPTDSGTVTPVSTLRSLATVSLPAAGQGTSAAPAPRQRPGQAWVRIADPKGDSISYVPDRSGRVQRYRDAEGRIGYSLRNAAGQDTLAVTPKGDTIHYQWTGADLTSVWKNMLATGRQSDGTSYAVGVQWLLSYTYNAMHEVTSVSGSTPPAWYWYGAQGQLDSARVGSLTAPKSRYRYYANGRFRAAVDPVGHSDSVAYQGAGTWQNTSAVVVQGSTTTYSYDSFGRPASTLLPTGQTSSVTRDTLGRVLSTTDPLQRTVAFAFGAANGSYLSSITDAKGQQYGFLPNVLGIDTAAVEPDGGRTHAVLNRAAGLRSTTNRRGQAVTLDYDGKGRLSAMNAPDGKSVTYAYDAASLWMAAINAESADTAVVDTTGRPVRFSATRNGRWYEGETYYDTQLRLNRLFMYAPGGPIDLYREGFNYRDDGTLGDVQAYGPIGGAQDSSVFTYDADHLPTQVTLPTGDTILLGYTSTHALSSIRFKRTALDTIFGVLLGRDSVGRITFRHGITGTGGRRYSYDAGSQLTGYSDVSEGFFDPITNLPSGSCTQDAVTGWTCYPGYGTFTWSSDSLRYDRAQNRLPAPFVGYQAHVAYLGWQDEKANGADAGVFNQGWWMEALKVRVGNLPPGVGVAYQSYVEGSGWQAEVSNGALSGTTGQGIALDAVKLRLTGAPAGWSICYTPKVMGGAWQLESCDGAQAGTVGQKLEGLHVRIVAPAAWKGDSLAFSAGNRLTQARGFTLEYDADGNLTHKYSPTFDQRLYWNSLGQLDSAKTNGQLVSYGYDAAGRRVRKTTSAGTTRYLYAGANLAMVLGAGDTVQTRFYYYPGVDQPYAMQTRDGSMYYYVRDEQGSVAGLLDSHGAVVDRYRYTPWGEATQVSETVANPLRFSAREYDAETGLYFYRARYYDPALGRFVSEDPIGLEGGINKYAYVGNDPVNFTDPAGLQRVCVITGYLRLSWGDYSGAGGSFLAAGSATEPIQSCYYLDAPASDRGGPGAGYGAHGGTGSGAPGHGTTVGGSGGGDNDGGLSDSERILIGTGEMLKPVQTPLEIGGVAALAAPLAIMAAGTIGSGMTVLRLPLNNLRVWRAVMNPELEDLAANGGRLRNIFGIESKYFSFSPAQASRYAQMATRAFGEGPYTLVESTVPTDALTGDMFVTVDRGISALVVGDEVLASMTPVTVLPYMFIP